MVLGGGLPRDGLGSSADAKVVALLLVGAVGVVIDELSQKIMSLLQYR
jgi:hypothetical protein